MEDNNMTYHQPDPQTHTDMKYRIVKVIALN